MPHHLDNTEPRGNLFKPLWKIRSAKDSSKPAYLYSCGYIIYDFSVQWKVVHRVPFTKILKNAMFLATASLLDIVQSSLTVYTIHMHSDSWTPSLCSAQTQPAKVRRMTAAYMVNDNNHCRPSVLNRLLGTMHCIFSNDDTTTVFYN